LVYVGLGVGEGCVGGWKGVGSGASSREEYLMPVNVRLARLEDAPVLDQVLSDSFFDEPINGYFFPNADRRDAASRLGMGYVLREMYIPKDGAWTTEDLDGVAMWNKPGDPEPSAFQQLKGLPTMARAFRGRLPKALAAFSAAEKLRPAEPHWHLDIVGVSPDRQGLGIGSALVNTGLTEADRAGVPAFLVTSDAPNVPFYEHFGFAVTEEFDIGPVHGWAMFRQPQPA
jgi:GNAT superfamily N-acetyltransferase